MDDGATSLGKDDTRSALPEEEEDPKQSWSSQFELKMSALIDRMSGRRADRLSKEFLAQKKILEYNRWVHRARLTKDFLASEFWRTYLAPLLDQEQALRPWMEGDSRLPQEIASSFLFASGKARLASTLLSTFEDWIKKGEEASKILLEDEAKRKRAKELTATSGRS